MNFKIVFPSGYQLVNPLDDNLDLNIYFENGDIYFATLFTISNIQRLMQKDNANWFWATDMMIVKDLNKETIRQGVSAMLEHRYYENGFSKIGTLQHSCPEKTFEDIIDMSDEITTNLP